MDNLQTAKLFFSALFSIALIIGQVSPMQANNLMLGESGWIEICGGDDGSYFVQTAQDGETQDPSHDCLDCSLCAATANGANGLQTASAQISVLKQATVVAFLGQCSVLADCPEKLWSKTRGPPIASISKYSFSAVAFNSFQLTSENSESALANAVGAS